jgi:hypothetical protein
MRTVTGQSVMSEKPSRNAPVEVASGKKEAVKALESDVGTYAAGSLAGANNKILDIQAPVQAQRA